MAPHNIFKSAQLYKKRNCSDDTSCSKLQHSVCVKPARTTVAMTSIASTESSSSQIIYGKCECDSGYYYNNSQFACQKVLRNNCGVSDGANTCSYVQHAICAENKTCVCGPGFEINAQNTSCNEVHKSTCSPQNQHFGCLFLPNSICTIETKNSGSSLITVRYHSSSTFLSSPSTKTTATTTTTTSAITSQLSDEAESFTCLCKHGYYYLQLNETHAACEPVLGRPCDNDQQCSGIINAVCKGMLHSTTVKRCFCANGFDSSNQLFCFEVYRNKNCSNDTSCSSLQHSRCVRPVSTTVKTTSIPSTKTILTETSISQIIYGKCECDSGYYYNNSKFACKKGCNLPDVGNTLTVIESSQANDNLFKQGFVLNYKCKEGYVFDNNSTNHVIKNTTCLFDGTFQQLKSCYKKDCHKPEHAPSENIQSINLTQKNETTYKANATVICLPGYVYPNGSSRKTQYNISCTSKGTWEIKYNCVKIGL
ncbi:uncharacterized protein LOC132721734 [Ruditapes philippinarum]|uniref:uncharacterized protein LOC132721734 n=1 Tax=Ruditapes philippinarum TaxID=129788 RepID=UPI00295B6D1E|nr:uncharacterized protein LOC132721734 [Ruditapes philippinarum]